MVGNKLPVYSLDFETYYDSKLYTLKKLTTIEYVRDARFKAHGCAVVHPKGYPFWVTHANLVDFFNSIDWSKSAVLFHNANFDGLILSEHYGKIPAYYLDTMAMSRGEFGPGVSASLEALTQRLGNGGKLQGELEKTDGIRDLSKEQETALIPYALNDAVKMRKDFEDLYFDRGYPEQELHIIDLTVRTFTRPLLRINAALCRAEIEAEDARMKILLESDLIGGMELSAPCAQKIKDGGITALMRSRDCFAEMLRARGIEPPIKERMKAGIIVPGEFTYAFAKNDVEMQILGEDPRVSDIVAAWTGLKSTMRKARAERFLSVTHEGTKTLPIPLMYCGGRTHRWSGCCLGSTCVTILRKGVMKKCALMDVQKTDLVWDGDDFVQHNGVVFSGIQEVISYNGLTATKNHPVYIDRERHTTLEEAAQGGYCIEVRSPPTKAWLEENRQRLIYLSGQDSNNLPSMQRNQDRKSKRLFSQFRSFMSQLCSKKPDERDNTFSTNGFSRSQKEQRECLIHTAEYTGNRVSKFTACIDWCKESLQQQKEQLLEKLWWTRNNFWVRFYSRCSKMGLDESRLSAIGNFIGQNRQQQGIRTREFAVCNKSTTSNKSTKRWSWSNLPGPKIWGPFAESFISALRLYLRRFAQVYKAWMDRRADIDFKETQRRSAPVYDILDCGPRHRFVGNGLLIHNSDSINPQNLNSGRDGRGSRLREAIEAPPGFMIVDLDLAQIELRVSAWFSGETELLEDLRQGRDPYSKLASEIFGVEVTKNNENYQYRFVGKEGELSLGFGVGHKKFFNTIQTKYGLPVDQFSELDAQKTVNLYRNKRTGIVRTWNEIKEFIPMMAGKIAGFDYKMLRIENDRVLMPNDLYMHYKDIHWHYDRDKQQGAYIYAHKKDWVRIYAAKMYENWIQSIARSIVAEQAVNIAKELPIVLLVHDQIMSLAPENEAEDALAFALKTMRTPPSWCADLPLDAEGHIAKNYVK